MMHTYVAHAGVDTDRVWTITVPELFSEGPDGRPIPATGMAVSWAAVPRATLELIAAWEDMDPDDVNVEIVVGIPAEAMAAWEEGVRLEAQARRMMEESSRLRRQAVRLAHDAGYPNAASARAFGVSQQRVAQLV